MSDPIDIVERLAGMSADHGPDGWPAVQMRDISALCAEITRLRAGYQYSEQHAARLMAERDEARAALAAQVPQWISVTDDRKPKIGQDVLLWVRAERHGEDDDGRPYSQDASGVHQGRYIDSVCGPRLDCYTTPVADHEMATHWMDEPAAPGASPSPAAPQWECKAGGLKPLTDAQYQAQPPNIQRHYTRIAPPPAALAVPAGMALVPVEPTPEMVEAITECINLMNYRDGARAGWKSAIAASPQESATTRGRG